MMGTPIITALSQTCSRLKSMPMSKWATSETKPDMAKSVKGMDACIEATALSHSLYSWRGIKPLEVADLQTCRCSDKAKWQFVGAD